MAHVGVHRLTACHREKGGAQDGETDVEIPVDQKIESVKRAHGNEYPGRLHYTVDAEQCEHQEPGEHHRPEYIADEASAFPLHDEKPDQDDEGERHHGGR